LKYNLQFFDQLINNNGEGVKEKMHTIIEEIKETAFTLRTEEEIKLYIQNHQSALIEHKKCDSVSIECDQILYFLETNFQRFTNEMLLVSDLGKQWLYNQYVGFVDEWKHAIKVSLNEKLRQQMEPLTEPEKCNHCTIHYVKYVSQFWNNWVNDYSSPVHVLKDEVMINFLISQNFNSPTFFKYIVGEIIGELHQEDDPYVQEHVLLSYAKRFSIIPVKIGVPFRPDYPCIKPILEEWINIEIKQCRKKQKKHNPEQQAILSKGIHKIETSMSVAQTAYLFKLLSKSGIVANKTQMDILHVLSERFTSKKADQISFDSLHNKYYNVEDRTKESVRELLEKLIKSIE
jgi:hypothetical protein